MVDNFCTLFFKSIHANINKTHNFQQGILSLSDFWPWDCGFYSRYFHNFKCGLGLKRGSSSQLGNYLIEKYRSDFKKSTLLHLTESNANNIIPSQSDSQLQKSSWLV